VIPSSPVRHRVIAAGLLAAFLSALDTTILSTVMPTVASELGGLSLYSWVFAVYMVMAAVSMPIWGKLSDLLGKKRLFIAAVALFLAGSMLCGLSRSMMQLILFRLGNFERDWPGARERGRYGALLALGLLHQSAAGSDGDRSRSEVPCGPAYPNEGTG
jgi:MFS family permease